MECPLVWKEGRKRIKSGESVRWHLKDGYARISFPNLIVVHRLVSLMNSDYDYLGNVPMVDHIDNNKLNNFASNLRFVSISQNARNTRKRVGSSSRFHHVYFNRRDDKWRTQVSIGGVHRSCGVYKDEEEAAIAVDKYLVERLGVEGVLRECYKLNFPERYGISVDEGGGMDIKDGWEIPEPPQMGLF